MKTGTKIALWVAGIAVVSVGGYFIYKSMKKSREEKAEKELSNKPSQKPLSIPSLGQQLFTDTTVNPFQDMLSLTMFQNWVIGTKKDKAILGSTGADGKWGKNSAAAWAKYGKEYDSLSKR
jgi:hypothetical protein